VRREPSLIPVALAAVLGAGFIVTLALIRHEGILFVDYLRFVGFTIFATIAGAWGSIMWEKGKETLGNYRLYHGAGYTRRRALFRGTRLELHIWLISLSYLGFVASNAVVIATRIGEPAYWYGTPIMLVFGPMGLVALWLLLRPRVRPQRFGRRKADRPDA
jgi:hypothetical protein